MGFRLPTLTDYRAIELGADLLLATKTGVDGVYDADPATDPSAVRYDTISFDDVIEKGIQVMDPAAFTTTSSRSESSTARALARWHRFSVEPRSGRW